MTDHRPRVVLITGTPGSGKSTLGTALAGALRVPFLARDDVRGGLFLTAGAWGHRPARVPPPDEAVEAFLRLVETAASLGVSCVAEYVVRRHRPADLRRLTVAADCVAVVTECRDALDRAARRGRADRLLNRRPVLDALGYATVDDHTAAAAARMGSVAGAMRVDLGLPTLRVATDDGYEPGLDAIVEFAVAATPRRPAPPPAG
ncbi:MAG TPA: AAA family ATPase [Acidimicrobiales bacterium]|nr:AAA family ATPase [Acidimicrobiales bacterium]